MVGPLRQNCRIVLGDMVIVKYLRQFLPKLR